MAKWRTPAGVALLMLAALAAWHASKWANPVPLNAASSQPSPGLFETRHYAITSTATEPQTRLVADAVESLHDEYLVFFAESIRLDPRQKRLQLTLYKDQGEFKGHNKSSSWAEAYYLPPTCYAYFAGGEQNPYHWMIHEATHQLNHEVAHFPNSQWIGEGIASYFGTSVIQDGKLIPGRIDVNSYPIWWLAKLKLTGDLQNDIRSGKVIELRALISGIGGPKADEKVNARYIGYWSLTHFLFHFQNGRYAHSYRQLISAGGSIDNFERFVGPIDRIENEWYAYLQHQAADIKRNARGRANKPA